MGRLMLAESRLAGEAEALDQASGGSVACVDHGSQLPCHARCKQVIDQRGGAFAGDALLLAVGAGDVADFEHTLFMRGEGDEAAGDLSVCVHRDPCQPRPVGRGEPVPQLLRRGEGFAGEVQALLRIAEGREQRMLVPPLERPHGEPRSRKGGNIGHGSR